MKVAEERRRFRLSIRALMIAVAVFALVLTPVVWLVRQNVLLQSAQMRAMEAEQRAMVEAERARYVAQVQSAQALFVSKAADPTDHPDVGLSAPNGNGLWAAIGVNHVVFHQSELKGLNIEFTLVNDGEATIDPKIGESRIVVQGKELANSGLILGNGPRDARFAALPPGQCLRLSGSMGDQFKEPGIYRVSWRGANFRSPEVVFRVLPEKTD